MRPKTILTILQGQVTMRRLMHYPFPLQMLSKKRE
jgi:hypothetical protein